MGRPKLNNSRKNASRKKRIKQVNFQLASRWAIRLKQCPRSRGWNPGNGRLKQAGSPSHFFTYTAAAAARPGAGAGELQRIPRRRSRFGARLAFSSQIQCSHSPAISPGQIVIFAAFYAEMRTRVCSDFEPMSGALCNSLDVYLRWCFSYFLRSRFPLRFFPLHDSSSAVGENSSTNGSIQREPNAWLGGNEVPGRFGNLVSMRARAVCARALWLHLYTRITVQKIHSREVLNGRE